MVVCRSSPRIDGSSAYAPITTRNSTASASVRLSDNSRSTLENWPGSLHAFRHTACGSATQTKRDAKKCNYQSRSWRGPYCIKALIQNRNI